MAVRGVVTYAGNVRSGDRMVVDGETVVIDRVTKVRGTKPREGGENLYLMVGDVKVRRQALDPVRVFR